MADADLGKNSRNSNLTILSSKADKFNIVDEAEDVYQVKQKYKDLLLLLLYWAGMLLHAVLADRLGLSASGLNATIKRINDVDRKPVEETRSGKFKYYSLTEEGTKYVQEELLPLFADSEECERSAHNLFNLLNSFKEQNHGNWIAKLSEILDKELEGLEEKDDDADPGYVFINEYSGFYRKTKKKAEVFLSFLLTDKDLIQKILMVAERKNEFCGKNIIEILNQWDEDDCAGVCHMIDDMFDNLSENKRFRNFPNPFLGDKEECMEALHNKLMADMFCAIACNMDKAQLAQRWIEENMEKHVALYIAEKYRILYKKITQSEWAS